MPPIPVDAELSNRLARVLGPVELCNPAGRVIGRFVPVLDPSEWEAVTPEISDEERARRKKSKEQRYTTEEFVKRLESL
jgi:hypothetical protein